jgi:hypothetical protein
MRSLIRSTALLVALAAPALADTYPVSGRWGQSASTQKGPIECHGRRVITFSGNQRRDTGGGVPAYRNISVTPDERAHYRVVDEFTNGQISAGRVYYTLVTLDADHIELQMQQGGTLKLQRCK